MSTDLIEYQLSITGPPVHLVVQSVSSASDVTRQDTVVDCVIDPGVGGLKCL